MKQAFVKKNGVYPREVPAPNVKPGRILVEVMYSCISAGTEMSAVKNANKSLIKRALEDPRKLVPAAAKIMFDRGPRAVIGVVKGATGGDFGKPLGYTAAGVIKEVGVGCDEFIVGQRVAISGVGIANHAGIASVPKNMAVQIPDAVTFEEASTVAVGCIAMQGVRRLEPILGETIVVMGLGIIGLLSIQMLKSQGCKVLGIDINEDRLQLGLKLGCDAVINGNKEDMVKRVMLLTNGNGADGTLFTAATASSIPLSNCFKSLRRKGRLVLVGVSGMEINRADIYSKELDFKIATSYGPGRYDEDYENKGMDYPIEYVRWTENRNMQEYLRLIQTKDIKLNDLIESIYSIDKSYEAYEELKKPNAPLIVLLNYSDDVDIEKNKKRYYENKINEKTEIKSNIINYAVIGAGNFVKSMHLPNLANLSDKYRLKAVMSTTGSSAAFLASLYNAEYSTSDFDEILKDSSIEMVMICTRHDSHAPLAIRALKAGKAVFVEKPVAVNDEQLKELIDTIKNTKKPYMVGFNRRFSNYIVEIKEKLKNNNKPISLSYTMNAGYIPLDHWVHSTTGGGRIVGEGCHIIDVMNYLVGSKVNNITVNVLKDDDGYYSLFDNVIVTLDYEDGSIGILKYISNGSIDYQKETLDIYFDNKLITLNDYMNLKSTGIKLKNIKSNSPAKGHLNELVEFYKSIKDGDGYPISIQDFEQTTQITLMINDQIMRVKNHISNN